MRFACWINKATNTHSEYVILINFPLQEVLGERLLILRYTYSACLVELSASWKATIFIFETILKLQLQPCLEMC